MPFVQEVRNAMETLGEAALDTRGRVDELRVLSEAADYIRHTLSIDTLSIKLSTSNEAHATTVCPSAPVIEFYTKRPDGDA